MWFIYAIMSFLFWALADLFYKIGNKETDKYSHLKTGIMVGIVMGIHASFYWLGNDIDVTMMEIIKYLPVSFCYILSMIIGYKGLKYIELSISSPIQNTSGIITSLLLVLIFKETLGRLDIGAIILIFIGLLWLALLENKEENKVTIKNALKVTAIVFPILYCILDGMGTFLDAIYLDKLMLINEDVALIAYEYTFLIYGIIVFIYLKWIKKERISFSKEKTKIGAAIFETIGQFFYVFAIGGNSTLAIPIIGSYSIGSVILSRIFLKEKLELKEYIAVSLVIIGIVLLGISEIL